MQHFDPDRGKYVCTYIRDENIDFAKQIAHGEYYKKLHTIMIDQLEKLRTVKIFILDHVSRLDSPEYHDTFVWNTEHL